MLIHYIFEAQCIMIEIYFYIYLKLLLNLLISFFIFIFITLCIDNCTKYTATTDFCYNKLWLLLFTIMYHIYNIITNIIYKEMLNNIIKNAILYLNINGNGNFCTWFAEITTKCKYSIFIYLIKLYHFTSFTYYQRKLIRKIKQEIIF